MTLKRAPFLLLLPLVWGGYYVASQQSVARMSLFSVGILIRFICLILLTIIMLKRGELKTLFCVKGILFRLIMTGVLGFSLDVSGFLGLTYSSAGIGTALLTTNIIFVNLISLLIFKERFKVRDWLFTLVTLFGVFLVLGIDFGNMDLMNWGNIFFILSAIFISINAFVIKSAQTDKKNPASDFVVAYYNNFVTMVFFIIAALVTGTYTELRDIAVIDGFIVAVTLAGIGQTLVYIVYYYNLRRNPVWIVKACNLLMPVVAMVIAFALFGTIIYPQQLLGVAVVLMGALGILLGQKPKKRVES